MTGMWTLSRSWMNWQTVLKRYAIKLIIARVDWLYRRLYFIASLLISPMTNDINFLLLCKYLCIRRMSGHCYDQNIVLNPILYFFC